MLVTKCFWLSDKIWFLSFFGTFLAQQPAHSSQGTVNVEKTKMHVTKCDALCRASVNRVLIGSPQENCFKITLSLRHCAATLSSKTRLAKHRDRADLLKPV